MKAIILAAGRGSRMGAVTADQPKCLAKLRGRTLLEWQMAALTAAGVAGIGLVRGYRGDLLEGFGAERLFDNSRWAETNMVRSLECASEWLKAGPCLVSYSDIVYRPEAPAALMACKADIAITFDPNWLDLWSRRAADPLADAETFRRHPDGTLAEIGARPKTIAEVEGQYMGLLRFTPAGWRQVEAVIGALGAAADRLDMTSLLSRLLAAGTSIGTVAYEGGWGEADNAEDLALYEAMMEAGELRL